MWCQQVWRSAIIAFVNFLFVVSEAILHSEADRNEQSLVVGNAFGAGVKQAVAYPEGGAVIVPDAEGDTCFIECVLPCAVANRCSA